MASNVGTASGTLKLNSSGWNSGFSSAKSSLASFGKQSASTALGMIGAGGIQQAISSVTGAIKQSVQSFIEFESAMAEVSTLVNTANVDMKSLESGVVDLSKKYGQDAGGLANALYQVISAGVDAGDAIQFLDVATKAAIGGVTDTKTAVDVLTSAMNAYGLSTDDVTDISDSLFTTVKLGKTTLGELAGSVGQIAPIAAATGVKLDEMNSALATLTLSGLSTSEAGTALRGMMNALLKPQEKALTLAQELGIEFGATAVQTMGFSEWLAELTQKTGGNTEALAMLFPEVRGMNAMLQLTSETGAANYNNAMQEMADKTGAAAEATQKMAETNKMTWSKVGQWTSSVGRKIGDLILKPLSSMAESHSKMEKQKRFIELLEKESHTLDEVIELNILAKSKIDEYNEALENKNDLSAESIKWYEDEIVKLKQTVKVTDSMVLTKKLEAATSKEVQKQDKEESKGKSEIDKKVKEIIASMKKKKSEHKAESNTARESLKLQIESLEAMHNVDVRNSKERIEMLEYESNKENLTNTQSLEMKQRLIEAKQELSLKERDHALKVLGMTYDAKVKEYEKEKKNVTELTTWYKAKRAEILVEWSKDVETTERINTEIQANLDRTAFQQLGKEITDNFNKWKDSFIKGNSSSWKEFITDSKSSINMVADLFGGLPDSIAGPLDSLTNLIITAISGNPIKTATSALGFVGSMIGLSGQRSKEAADANKISAQNAREAAKSFLKASGKVDLSTLSYNELQQEREGSADAIANYLIGIGQLDEGNKADFMNRLSTRGMGYGADAGAGANVMSTFSYLRSVQGGRTGDSTLSGLIGSLSGIMSTQAERARYQQWGMGSSLGDPSTATTWSGFKMLLDAQLQNGKINESDYKSQLKSGASKFWKSIDPSEYMDIQAMAKGGITTQPTMAMLSEHGQKEAVIPLDDRNRVREIIGEIGGVGKLDLNISISGETSSAQEVGEIVGDKLEVLFRSKGI